jgi:hypothetical protein
MKRSEYGAALSQWVAAQKRIEAAEEQIQATLLDVMFPPGSQHEPAASQRPSFNVKPPKQPQKK